MIRHNHRQLIENLEERVMLSAVIPASELMMQTAAVIMQAAEDADSIAPSEQVQQDSNSLVIIDSSLAGLGGMLDHLSNDGQVFIIDSEEDGLAQIDNILSENGAVTSLHIVTPSHQGSLMLGSTLINQQTIEALEPQFNNWSNSLQTEADIMFYGTDFASDAEGQKLLEKLALYTGADTAVDNDFFLPTQEQSLSDTQYAQSKLDLYEQQTLSLLLDETEPTADCTLLSGSCYHFSEADFIGINNEVAPETELEIISLPLSGSLEFDGSAVLAGALISAATLSKLSFTPDEKENSNKSHSCFSYRARKDKNKATEHKHRFTFDIIGLYPQALYWSKDRSTDLGEIDLNISTIQHTSELGPRCHAKALAFDGFADFVYWTDCENGLIQRAALGHITQAETVLTLGSSTKIHSLAIKISDSSGRLRLYWAEDKGIFYIDFSGEEDFANFTYSAEAGQLLWSGQAHSLSVDSESEDIYACSRNQILLIPALGGDAILLVDFPEKINDLAIDILNDVFYWSSESEIWSSDFSLAISSPEGLDKNDASRVFELEKPGFKGIDKITLDSGEHTIFFSTQETGGIYKLALDSMHTEKIIDPDEGDSAVALKILHSSNRPPMARDLLLQSSFEQKLESNLIPATEASPYLEGQNPRISHIILTSHLGVESLIELKQEETHISLNSWREAILPAEFHSINKNILEQIQLTINDAGKLRLECHKNILSKIAKLSLHFEYRLIDFRGGSDIGTVQINLAENNSAWTFEPVKNLFNTTAPLPIEVTPLQEDFDISSCSWEELQTREALQKTFVREFNLCDFLDQKEN